MRLNQQTFSGDLLRFPYSSPVGTLNLISSSAGLRAILFQSDLEDKSCQPLVEGIAVEKSFHHKQAQTQLDEYFLKKRRDFDLPLDPVGSPFQLQAWQALQSIPFGEVYSYSDQAQKLGSPRFARAVGGANRSNPLSIVVPCHRVSGKDGSLTGFAGGLETKKFLLDLERAHCA